ncbi:MAG TPA: glycosyltransferase [Hydrogenispora sp.]|jgi:glycosyltransferase involved in cell wall biosynthesis|nr:glycosyltransferase [Hydrogenispora sp.]
MNYPKKQSLLAMLVVRNEADRFLQPVLDRLSILVDGIVILDDASTDHTPALCRAHPRVVRFERLSAPLFFHDEAKLREKLWHLTVELNPDWILAIDADEIFETRSKQAILTFLQQTQYELITFPVYHFWGDLRHYRVDRWWHPARGRTACLYRYQRYRTYHWAPRTLHCGRLPQEAYWTPRLDSAIPLLHLGYAHRREHQAKYRRYLYLDPQGEFCPLVHYQSILYSRPELRCWRGEDVEALLWN